MKKSTMVVLIMALSITACISGCGKQEEIVNAATVEQTTLENLSEPTEEESVIATEEETESIEETTTDETETESVSVQDFTITEMNKEMQATQNAVTFETPSADTAVGGVKQDEIVKVTGIVDGTDWYRIEQTDNTTSFIESIYLKEIEQQQPAQNENTNNSNENSNQDQNKQQPQVQTPPVVVTPPAPSGDTPVTDGDGEVQRLPDGGYIADDGTEIHPGDTFGNGTYMGSTEGWW